MTALSATVTFMTLIKSLPPVAPKILPGRLEKWSTLSPEMTHYKLHWFGLCTALYVAYGTLPHAAVRIVLTEEDQIVFTSPKWGSHLYPHFWHPKRFQERQRLGTSSLRTKVCKGALSGSTVRQQGLQGWAWHFPPELSLEAFWKQTGQGNVLDVPAAKGPPEKEPERDEQWKPQSACGTGPWASQHGPRELPPRHHGWNALTPKQEWVGTEKGNTNRRLAAPTGHPLSVLLLETSPERPGIQRREPH